MKKFGIILLVLLIVVGTVVYILRHEIFQVSAETIIRKHLPDYVHVDEIIFDLKEGILKVKGFAIKNPKGFHNKYLANIGSIICKYEMKGKNILDGIKVTGIEGHSPHINIERLSDGRINVNEMGSLMEEAASKKPATAEKSEKKSPDKKEFGGRTISDYIEITDTINIKNGKVMFLDKAVTKQPLYFTFEDVNADIIIDMSKDFTIVNDVQSIGSGDVNGDSSQQINWKIGLNPKTSQLTMSNRFEVRGVDIIPFRPYYYKYSPINIISGLFSGTLVFDFDNGNIGSMNTVRLRNFRFSEDQNQEASGFWDVSIADVIKYLRSSSGEIVFDFKIKGTMQNPRFFPGPIVKQAMQSMITDKVTNTVSDLLKSGQEEGQAAGAGKSDTEKVVDVLKELLNRD